MATCILLRHGQSVWNKQNLFTGWVNVGLSAQGVEEAINAGKTLSAFDIDYVYVSELIRAQQTAMLSMMHSKKPLTLIKAHSEHLEWHEHTAHNNLLSTLTPMYADWRLNERYYGNLQGQNKAEAIAKHGKEQVHIWRRSFDTPPPEGESLKMTCARTMPFFHTHIHPALQADKNILIVAHGNSLRALMMYIEGISAHDITQQEIATGIPIVYSWHVNDGFQRVTT